MLMMIIIVMIGTVSGELALSGYVYSQITLNICHNLSTKSRHWSNASICYLIIVPRVDINKILASPDEVQQMVRSDGGEAVRIDIGRSIESLLLIWYDTDMMDDHRSYSTFTQQLHVRDFCNIMANNSTLARITATTTSTTTTQPSSSLSSLTGKHMRCDNLSQP